MRKFYFVGVLIIIDFLFSQLFLLNILEKNSVNANKASFENRIFNENYKYTFNKLVNFKSLYYEKVYNISTNDLGFRDKDSKPIDRKKTYDIVIGDSFVEGVGLEYNDTIVGILNNNLNNQDHKFLNAGVSSYSSYIYYKKIKNIIETNNNLQVKNIIVLLDKSDVLDDEKYLDEPLKFKNTKGQFINKRKEDFFKDLKELSFWRFFTKQTMTGKTLKLLTDTVESFFSNMSKRVSLAKKLNKSFFDVSDLEIKAIKSINNRPYIKNWFVGQIWENKAKKNIKFSIKNIRKLRDYLITKDINLVVVLYPWSFEIEDKDFRNRYLNFIVPLLEKENINTVIAYNHFLKGNIYENIGKYFIYNDIHYNKDGYKIIANNILDYIKK